MLPAPLPLADEAAARTPVTVRSTRSFFMPPSYGLHRRTESVLFEVGAKPLRSRQLVSGAPTQRPATPPKTLKRSAIPPNPLAPHASGMKPPTIEPNPTHIHITRLSTGRTSAGPVSPLRRPIDSEGWMRSNGHG